MTQFHTQPYYHSKLYCEAVSASLDNKTFQGKITCREQRENGRFKTLWTRRTGQRMARLTKEDALKDAILMAQDLMVGQTGVELAILWTTNA